MRLPFLMPSTTSPLSRSRMVHSATALLALLTLASVSLSAQTIPDSAAAAGADSAIDGYRDAKEGVGKGGVGVDTLRAGSLPATSVQTRPDSTTPPDSTVTRGPVDSIILAACAGRQLGEAASDLLVVVFRDAATTAERDAAVAEVGGILVGKAPRGGDYVRLSADAGSARLAADRLIRSPAVSEVRERNCP